MRILAAQINPTIGDIQGNCSKILHALEEAEKQKAEIVITPELALTGYPPEDFLLKKDFIAAVEKALSSLIPKTKKVGLIVGLPRKNLARHGKRLFNSAAVLWEGKLLGYQDKMLLPTYDVFDERRYFEPGEKSLIWNFGNRKIGITICEDIWPHGGGEFAEIYAKDPIETLKGTSLELLVNLSASPYHVGKSPIRQKVASIAAIDLAIPVVLCNQVGGNDSLIFDGSSFLLNLEGKLISSAPAFEEAFTLFDTESALLTLPSKSPWEELFAALVLGIKDYFAKSGFKKACLGLSGGIDSALVACLAVTALGKENVLGIAMPSRYSSPESVQDAEELAKHLDIPLRTISIEGPFSAFLELLAPHFKGIAPDTTEENLQARIRGMLLMAFSNKFGMIVLSCGNKSELAMGYSTLYGDLCGGLAVISDLTKQQVYGLSHWINREQEIIPESTLTKEPTAELKPNQKDSDSLPPYELLDKILVDYIEEGLSKEEILQQGNYSKELVSEIVKKIHLNEYKRRQAPPGLRVSEKAFSKGRHFPIVQKWQ
jgi:NAD+ synthase (glutamine-hydrolysing)